MSPSEPPDGADVEIVLAPEPLLPTVTPFTVELLIGELVIVVF